MDLSLMLTASFYATAIAATTCWALAVGELNSIYEGLKHDAQMERTLEDEQLATRVRAVIVSDDHIEHGPVDVSAFNHNVTLLGAVNFSTRTRALKLATRVEGVQSIQFESDAP